MTAFEVKLLNVIAGLTAEVHQLHKAISNTVEHNAILKQIAHMEEKIMSAQTDLAAKLTAQTAAVTALGDKLEKIGTEIDAQTALIQTLKDAIANAPVAPEVQAAVDALDASITRAQTVAQADDDKNPDATTP